jgi:hypothetical protein
MLILLGSAPTSEASAYYSLTMEPRAAVSSPPVELQAGTATNSSTTIYTNGTSAKVSLGNVTVDYVDNNTSDVDNRTDKGTHADFSAQQSGPDVANDTLTERNTEPPSEYVWISGDDDLVRKLDKSDLNGTEILSWDTGTSYPFGCEFRMESGHEYIYVVDSGPNVDALIKFHATNGTEVTRWDISAYSGDAWGLAWNGSRWFIADKNDDLIYQVDPADPTVAERAFAYTGISIAAGLAWDGAYLWVVDFEDDYVYQIDVFGNIQTSWATGMNPNNPTGIAYDPTSGHLWIVSDATDYLHQFYTNGTHVDTWNPAGANPEGVAYASVEEDYNYELDVEVQWTSVDYDEATEALCIYGGPMGAENVTVDVWNGTAWHSLFNLTSGWNNVSVTSYLDASTFTIRFTGTTETNDTTQDTWAIDVTLLHVWTDAGSGDFNYVLKMVEQANADWNIRLKAYDQSNLSRLQNLTIYVYDGANSTQIVISNGAYSQQIGPWYDFNASDTNYLWIHFEPSSSGTSYVHVYLEIRLPTTTTYAQYIITFQIT